MYCVFNTFATARVAWQTGSMSKNAILLGPLVGRFYSLALPPGPGGVLVSRCSAFAWEDGAGKGLPLVRRFCCGDVPHGGDLAEDTVPLSYNDDGHGIWRLWLREEERRAGRMHVEQRANEIALEWDPDTPYSFLRGSTKKRAQEEAKRDILETALPTLRIAPVVISDEWAWVGRRASATDLKLQVLLSKLFGEAEVDPVVFSEDMGWSTAGCAVLRALVDKGSVFAPDVKLLDLDIQGKKISMRSSGAVEMARTMLASVEGEISETSVKRLSFEVYNNGCSTVLDVDSHGLCRGFPARSVGGLPHERIGRRFKDVRTGAGRVKEVMGELVAWAEGLG